MLKRIKNNYNNNINNNKTSYYQKQTKKNKKKFLYMNKEIEDTKKSLAVRYLMKIYWKHTL